MAASRVLLVAALTLVCLVANSSAGIRKRDTEDDIKEGYNDAVGSVNDAINRVVEASNCISDSNCNVLQYCDIGTSNALNLSPPTCAFHGWFLAAVIGVAIFALLTLCVSCFCCPCCCLYSMCKK